MHLQLVFPMLLGIIYAVSCLKKSYAEFAFLLYANISFGLKNTPYSFFFGYHWSYNAIAKMTIMSTRPLWGECNAQRQVWRRNARGSRAERVRRRQIEGRDSWSFTWGWLTRERITASCLLSDEARFSCITREKERESEWESDGECGREWVSGAQRVEVACRESETSLSLNVRMQNVPQM